MPVSASVTVVGSVIDTASTSEEGEFTFRGLEAGQWEIIAEAAGYSSKQLAVELASDKSVGILLESIPQFWFAITRERIARLTSALMWISSYTIFVFACALVLMALLGFVKASLDFTTLVRRVVSGLAEPQEPYVGLVHTAERYLTSFALLLLGVGMSRVTRSGLSRRIGGVPELDTVMVGVVVLALGASVLGQVFAGGIEWQYGLGIALVILALSGFMLVVHIQRQDDSKSQG